MPADDAIAAGPGRPWVDRVLDWSGSVYGIILASSLIAALSYKERGNAWVMIGALLASEAVFALAHALSELLGGGRARGSLPGLPEVRTALRYEWPVLQAAWPTLLLLLLLWTAGQGGGSDPSPDWPHYGGGPDQMRIAAEGNAYLTQNFPRLDFIRRARVVP